MSEEKVEPVATQLLKKAIRLQEERAATYDVGGTMDGERSMGKTVAAFNIITGRNLSESEGWLLLQVLKDVRDRTNGPHLDSLEDGIAYSSLKAEARLAEIPVKRIHIASTTHEEDFCNGCRHNGPSVRMVEHCLKCDASTRSASRWEAAPSKYRSCDSCYWAGTPGITTDKCSSCESRGDAPPSNWG